ncbi:hypothetical protein ACJX0J_012164 [Zea mays]
MSLILQRKHQNIVQAMSLVVDVKTLLINLRSEGWEPLFEETKTFCLENDIPIPNMEDMVGETISLKIIFFIIKDQLEDLSKIMVRLERHILALLLPRDIFKGLDLQKIKKAFQKKKDRQMQLPHYSCFVLNTLSQCPYLHLGDTAPTLCCRRPAFDGRLEGGNKWATIKKKILIAYFLWIKSLENQIILEVSLKSPIIEKMGIPRTTASHYYSSHYYFHILHHKLIKTQKMSLHFFSQYIHDILIDTQLSIWILLITLTFRIALHNKSLEY